MMYLRLFAALAPTAKFPPPLMELTLHGDSYDLSLPGLMADNLYHIIRFFGTGIRQVEEHGADCSPNHIRADPRCSGFNLDGEPTYREFETRFDGESERNGRPRGWIRNRLFVSVAGAKCLVEYALHRKYFSPHLSVQVTQRIDYFKECGGFELCRMAYFYDKRERAEALSLFKSDRPAHLFERPLEKTRFGKFNLASSWMRREYKQQQP